ncbi:thioesterase family protein [Allobranchiibius sp. GilTou73]|uniref:thioesterase family protein n=1 Tax=Allobranchiibius sp. GilTou73 TaxID=2904523 RepID=UPI001F1E07C6|nr:thioesterase family protein [Allobranchiibius sp. GilTou73]UIJ33779.1 thioesterase family protein [Allobranchiibius sp. GilTou73]
MTTFDRTTRVHPSPAPGMNVPATSFVANLDETWSSLIGVHGGYVASLMVHAAELVLPDRVVRTVSTSFLRPASVGPADVALEILRAGRSFSTLSASVQQAGRTVAVSRITLLNPVDGVGWTTPTAHDRPAPIDRCLPFETPPSIAHFGQADFRIDPATVPTGDPEVGEGRIAGHIRPIETRPIDARWLVAMGDWFPPSPFRRLAPPVGGISIDYTVHLHRTLPADPDLWLEGAFTTAQNVGGIALEHGTLATPDGVPVAEAFHTRWTG